MAMSLRDAKKHLGEGAVKQIQGKLKEVQKNKGKSLSAIERNPLLKASTNPAEQQLEILARRVFEPSYTVVAQATDLIPGRRHSIDVYIPDLRLCLEMDGWQYHGKYKEDFQRDREKDQIFTLAGFEIARFYYAQVMLPERILETIEVLKQYRVLIEGRKK